MLAVFSVAPMSGACQSTRACFAVFACFCVVRACLLACLPACVPACLPACVPACVPACLHACVPAFARACVRTCLRLCLRAWVGVCFCVRIVFLIWAVIEPVSRVFPLEIAVRCEWWNGYWRFPVRAKANKYIIPILQLLSQLHAIWYINDIWGSDGLACVLA